MEDQKESEKRKNGQLRGGFSQPTREFDPRRAPIWANLRAGRKRRGGRRLAALLRGGDGFVPNRQGRALATARRDTLGTVVERPKTLHTERGRRSLGRFFLPALKSPGLTHDSKLGDEITRPGGGLHSGGQSWKARYELSYRRAVCFRFGTGRFVSRQLVRLG